jgi:hypothetical protein
MLPGGCSRQKTLNSKLAHRIGEDLSTGLAACFGYRGADEIKESVIGSGVIRRQTDLRRPQQLIVPNEAAKLRSRLTECDVGEGAADELNNRPDHPGYKPAFRPSARLVLVPVQLEMEKAFSQ